jgi:demethylmenaquinone methyltransferase/2-methoxy-6-polyprenyl-1,4-benzoquinol methylase
VDQPVPEQLLAEQRDYYRARAAEYDDWWFRRGVHDQGEEANERWRADVAEVERELERFRPRGDIVELAAGTGIWTEKLVQNADRVTAVDAAPETLALNRERTDDNVAYIVADLFRWEPQERFDVCFFGFWLSHVPSTRFARFWQLVDGALRPNGRVFFVDNADPTGGAWSSQTGPETARRRLADGREFNIIKRWFQPDTLTDELALLGWELHVTETANGFFIIGSGSRLG